MERATISEPTLKEESVSISGNCPGCSSENIEFFYHLDSVPTHSVLLMKTKEQAKNFTKSRINLGFCRDCEFVSNYSFDETLMHYSTECEESQAFSGTFNAFARRLAIGLINGYHLHRKRILEIGCGKGDFLILLCELGNNEGIGFDPAYIPRPEQTSEKTQFVQEFFTEKNNHIFADFVCCKMTLEHIHKTSEFISMLRKTINDPETVVFFQIPESDQIFDKGAFWDIYYEHSSYFNATSLENLFQTNGFDVTNTWTDYDDQYLMLEARIKTSTANRPARSDSNSKIYDFHKKVTQRIEFWRDIFDSSQNERIVLWGSGSKAVSFLNTLEISDDMLEYIVDINSHRWGTYSVGTGQEIVAPDFLKEYKPDKVIIMNPIYRAEITASIRQMGLDPEILTSEDRA